MPHEGQSQEGQKEKPSVETSCDDDDAVFVDAEPYDVLLGRGRGHVRHPGNIRFHGEVLRLLPRYEAATTYSEKISLTRQIVEYVQKMGRFLKKNTTKTRWMEIDDETARFCVSQAFRNHRRETVYADQPKQRHLAADPATTGITATVALLAQKATNMEDTGIDDDQDERNQHERKQTITAEGKNTTVVGTRVGVERCASPSPSPEEDELQPPPAPTSMTPTEVEEVISQEMRECRQTPPHSPPPPPPPPPPPQEEIMRHPPQVISQEMRGRRQASPRSPPAPNCPPSPPPPPPPPPPQEEVIRQPPHASYPHLSPEALWYPWSEYPPHPPLSTPLRQPPPPRVIMGPPSYASLPPYPVIPQQLLSAVPPPWAMRPQGEMALRRWRGLLDNPWLFTEEDLFHALLRRQRGRQPPQQQQQVPDQRPPVASREFQLPERMSPQRLPPRKRSKLAE